MTEEFLTYLLTEKRYSELTVRAYGDDIRQFAFFCLHRNEHNTSPTAESLDDAFARFDPSIADSADLSDWIIELSGKRKLSARSINRKISSLKSLYRYLRKKGIVHKDPFTRISSLKTSRTLPKFVEESRMSRLCDSLTAESDDFETERDALIVLLFYSTGIRLAEIIGITLDDLSQNYSTLKVRGKGDKERIVPVMDAVRQKIKHYLTLRNGQNICISHNNYLFLSHKGDSIARSKVYGIVHGVLQGAGVQGKCSPHVLRHTFATHLLNGGVDIRTIQELLGHSTLEATQVYTHNSIGKLKQAYNSAHPRAKNKV